MITITITTRYIYDVDARTLVPGHYEARIFTHDGRGHWTDLDRIEGEGGFELAEDEAQLAIIEHLGIQPKRGRRSAITPNAVVLGLYE